MPESDIQAVIIDDKAIRRCDGNCRLDWSSAETIRQAGQQIKARFQAGVQLKYLDLSQTNRETIEFREKMRSEGLSPPLLLINGEARISGEFDIRMLLDAIEAEIEMQRQL